MFLSTFLTMRQSIIAYGNRGKKVTDVPSDATMTNNSVRFRSCYSSITPYRISNNRQEPALRYKIPANIPEVHTGRARSTYVRVRFEERRLSRIIGIRRAKCCQLPKVLPVASW